jgi:RHS repeat-associated protein
LDGPSILEELDATGAMATSYLTNPQVIDEILSFQQNGATYYPLTDALVSIYAIADSTGALVARNGYDAYGARTTTEFQIAFGFTGREHDSDTTLVYQRHRYRDSALGVWNQPDRLGMLDGPNVYSYVTNRPADFRDWSGRWINRQASDRIQLLLLDQAIGTRIGWRLYTHVFQSGVEVRFVSPAEAGSERFKKGNTGVTWASSTTCPLVVFVSVDPARLRGAFIESMMVHELMHAYDIVDRKVFILSSPELQGFTLSSDLDPSVVNELGYELRGYGAEIVAEMEFGDEFDRAVEKARGNDLFKYQSKERLLELFRWTIGLLLANL